MNSVYIQRIIMKKQQNNKRSNNIIKISFAVLIALFALSYFFIHVFCFKRYATSDVYSDMLYAMEAWDAKSIFPDGWVFGNQLYTVATPVLCSLIYGICGNITASMICATIIMGVLTVLSFIWMLKPIKNETATLAALLLLLGGIITPNIATEPEGQLLFILASYYSCYLITFCITIGDYIRVLNNERRHIISLSSLLAYVLLFATGMQSIRQTAILIIPLFGYELLRCFTAVIRKSFDNTNLRSVLSVCLYTVANVSGLIFVKALNVPQISIYGDIKLSANIAEAHSVNMRILGKLTGIYFAVNEPQKILYIIPSVIITALTLISLIIGLIKAIKNKHSDNIFTIQSIIFISLLGLFCANLLLDMSFRTTYMFLYYALTAVSIAALTEKAKPALRNIIAILSCVACVCNWTVGFLPAIRESKMTEEQEDYIEIANHLNETEYEYLYGDWYTATMTALHTDGKIRAYCSFGGLFEVLPYINPQKVYGEEFNDRAVYLIPSEKLGEAKVYASKKGATLTNIQSLGDGKYYIFESDIPLMYTPN